MKWLRRWWLRVTHKHEFVVIWRGVVKWRSDLSGLKGKDNAILERCHCGMERGRQWKGRWVEIDIDWLSDQLARLEVDIPARHQE